MTTIVEPPAGDEDVGQPLLFALQVGVYRLLHAWGVRQVAVLGHSIGEVAAAFAAGALTLADAVRLIVHRSRAQETTRGAGAMAAVGLSEADARPLLARHPGRLHVALASGTPLPGDGRTVILIEFQGAIGGDPLPSVHLFSASVDELTAVRQ